MDREVVEQKLESLRHCLRRIEVKCPADAQTLATDLDLQDIVSLNLSRAWHIVHSIAKKHLADFSVFAEVASLRCLAAG